jgi:hypothetical protein
MLSSEQNVQASVATEDDSSNVVGQIILPTTFYNLYRLTLLLSKFPVVVSVLQHGY